MSASVEARVIKVAEGVRRRFLRRDAPADPADVFQDAAAAALAAARREGLSEDRNPEGYMWRAALCGAGLEASRALSVVSIAEKRAHLARHYQRRVGLDDPALRGLALPGDPESALSRRQEQADRRRLRVRFRRSLERYLRHLGELDRRAVEMLAGLDGRGGLGEEEAAAELGVTTKRVRRAVARLTRWAWDDIELRALHRALERMEIDEEAP